MGIKIGAFGYGIGAILAAGGVLLAALKIDSWGYFLGAAVIIWLISTLARKL